MIQTALDAAGRVTRLAIAAAVSLLLFACGGPNGPGPLPGAPVAACPANVTVSGVAATRVSCGRRSLRMAIFMGYRLEARA